MAAQYVKAYLKGNKNNGNDAAAICEAVSRPGMRFVAIHTDTQMLHRIRSRLVAERTALINQVRGLLGEYGLVFAQGPSQVPPWSGGVARRGRPTALRDGCKLLADLNGQFRALDEPQTTMHGCRLRHGRALPGIGPLTATALAAAIIDGKQFNNGRADGREPWAHATGAQRGGKQPLMGITKRVDVQALPLQAAIGRQAVGPCRAAITLTNSAVRRSLCMFGQIFRSSLSNTCPACMV
jgi:transposase